MPKLDSRSISWKSIPCSIGYLLALIIHSFFFANDHKRCPFLLLSIKEYSGLTWNQINWHPVISSQRAGWHQTGVCYAFGARILFHFFIAMILTLGNASARVRTAVETRVWMICLFWKSKAARKQNPKNKSPYRKRRTLPCKCPIGLHLSLISNEVLNVGTRRSRSLHRVIGLRLHDRERDWTLGILSFHQKSCRPNTSKSRHTRDRRRQKQQQQWHPSTNP